MIPLLLICETSCSLNDMAYSVALDSFSSLENTDSFLVSVGGDWEEWVTSSGQGGSLRYEGTRTRVGNLGLYITPKWACVLEILEFHFWGRKKDGWIVHRFFWQQGKHRSLSAGIGSHSAIRTVSPKLSRMNSESRLHDMIHRYQIKMAHPWAPPIDLQHRFGGERVYIFNKLPRWLSFKFALGFQAMWEHWATAK